MKILLPIDDSLHSDLAIESVKLRVWPRGTSVILCSIAPDDSTLALLTPKQQQLGQQALHMQYCATQQLLAKKANLLKYSCPSLTVAHECRAGAIAEGIIDIAADVDADLIVLGSHCRTGVERYAFGSVVQDVVPSAPCTVEVIRMSHRGGGECVEPFSELPGVLRYKRFLLCYDGSQNAKEVLQ